MPRAQQLRLNFDSHDTPSPREPAALLAATNANQISAPVRRVVGHVRQANANVFRTGNARVLPLFQTQTQTAELKTDAPDESVPIPITPLVSGEKTKARDILAAIRVLQQLDAEHRLASPDERRTLARFGGFGAVALSVFPDPVTGLYKDRGWEELGEELQSLLSPADYDSAKRSTFNAFYTSPTVMAAMHRALDRLGVPNDALILEPGCGSGNFMGQAHAGRQFLGVELDQTSGRIARALYPQHDIRIEDFRNTRLPEGSIEAVIGNVPFANLKLDYHGQKLSLHDYFFAKSVDALKPGGVLSLVTSRFTLDKQNAAIREYLASKADFVGAIGWSKVALLANKLTPENKDALLNDAAALSHAKLREKYRPRKTPLQNQTTKPQPKILLTEVIKNALSLASELSDAHAIRSSRSSPPPACRPTATRTDCAPKATSRRTELPVGHAAVAAVARLSTSGVVRGSGPGSADRIPTAAVPSAAAIVGEPLGRPVAEGCECRGRLRRAARFGQRTRGGDV